MRSMPIPDEDVGQECAKSEQKKEDKGEYTERLMENTENIIELRHLKKCYEPDKPVIEDFNLTVKKGEFVTFLGPSGCGKTTILRMIAGFEEPTEGEILLHGKDISKLPPNERQVNTVFQNYALFPHLNIYDNIAFGLRQRKVPKDQIREKVRRVLEIVDLEGFEKRSVSSLSGGQQQRIAIARAIVNEPEILLLDEPLSALDYKMRQEMQLELKLMHEQLGITFIFVTHDQEEAMTMSDKIVVIANGMLQQEGTAEEIYSTPSNAFVADFIGESNIFNGRKSGERSVYFAGAEFDCASDLPVGTMVDAMVRPQSVILTAPGEGRLAGQVLDSVFRGRYYDVTAQSGKNEIISQEHQRYEPGDEVGVDIRPEGIHLMPRDLTVNHLVGVLDEKLRVCLEGAKIPVPAEKLFTSPQEKKELSEGTLGRRLASEGTRVEISFHPRRAQLSDDPEAGIFRGNITSIIYKGDHYSYQVTDEYQEEYTVDDEYLWNEGDFVSVIVPEDAMEFKLLDARGKGGDKG